MSFIDSTHIEVIGGDGGPGIVSFRTARNRPKLGADGGNGGKGGDVILEARSDINTLSNLRYKRIFKAENGQRGGPNCRTGRSGDDRIIEVPCGTVALDENKRALGELLKSGDRLVVATGGKHGYGNQFFVRSTRQAPRFCLPGEKGTQLELDLELKLLADVGFAGMPNAGKSTLLSQISAAKPKIGDYPFTTLTPNLGVVEVEGNGVPDDTFVAADIPGLIEGASDGLGLGHQFLKHLDRTSVVVYVLDSFNTFEQSTEATFLTLSQELEKYSPHLASKQAIIVLNKTDLCDPAELEKTSKILTKKTGKQIFQISAATGQGILELKRGLKSAVAAARAE